LATWVSLQLGTENLTPAKGLSKNIFRAGQHHSRIRAVFHYFFVIFDSIVQPTPQTMSSLEVAAIFFAGWCGIEYGMLMMDCRFALTLLP
jgi:hypothetical protein